MITRRLAGSVGAAALAFTLITGCSSGVEEDPACTDFKAKYLPAARDTWDNWDEVYGAKDPGNLARFMNDAMGVTTEEPPAGCVWATSDFPWTGG